jgi:hypothetical protein
MDSIKAANIAAGNAIKGMSDRSKPLPKEKKNKIKKKSRNDFRFREIN